MLRLILLALLLAACTPTNAPNELVALGNVRNTATAEAVSTQAAAQPVTQSYLEAEYAKSLTSTALPPQQTATQQALQLADIAITQEWDNRTLTAVAQTVAYSQTQVVMTLEASDAQVKIAQNNAAIADATNGANLRRDVMTWGGGLLMFGFGVLVLWIVIQLGLYAHNTRKDKEKSDKWRRIFEAEKLMLASGVAPTSAGPTSYSVVPLAEKHVAQYANRLSRDDQVRAALKTYVTACVDLSRRGVRQPFSRANACKHLLITHPATGDWWQLGHDRIVKMLRGMGVLDNTGSGGETVLVVDVDGVARHIDLTPLPDLPFDPIPAVKITLAGSQVTPIFASSQV